MTSTMHTIIVSIVAEVNIGLIVASVLAQFAPLGFYCKLSKKLCDQGKVNTNAVKLISATG
jgi:hypothetical protein